MLKWSAEAISIPGHWKSAVSSEALLSDQITLAWRFGAQTTA